MELRRKVPEKCGRSDTWLVDKPAKMHQRQHFHVTDFTRQHVDAEIYGATDPRFSQRSTLSLLTLTHRGRPRA
jgi:hypothetical protein